MYRGRTEKKFKKILVKMKEGKSLGGKKRKKEKGRSRSQNNLVYKEGTREGNTKFITQN